MTRARGQGRIYLRGSRWWITYFGPDPARPGRKKRYYESAGSDDPRLAERALQRRLREIYGDRFVGPQLEKVTIGELLREYRTHRELNDVKSQSKFRSQLKRVEEFFGAARRTDITTAGLEAWAKATMKPVGPYAKATVKQWLSILRAAMRLPLKRGEAVKLPAFPTIVVKNARQGFVEPTAFEAIAAKLEQPWTDIARFAYETFWREGEVLALAWPMVDRRHGTITLPDSKSGEARVIPIVGDLAGVIERRWASRALGCSFVFHVRGRQITSFRKRWNSACAAAGYPGVLFHDLRRSGARDSRNSGVAEGVIMKRGGWKTRHVFERYNIVALEDQRQAALQMSEYRAAQLARVGDRTETIARASEKDRR